MKRWIRKMKEECFMYKFIVCYSLYWGFSFLLSLCSHQARKKGVWKFSIFTFSHSLSKIDFHFIVNNEQQIQWSTIFQIFRWKRKKLEKGFLLLFLRNFHRVSKKRREKKTITDKDNVFCSRGNKKAKRIMTKKEIFH